MNNLDEKIENLIKLANEIREESKTDTPAELMINDLKNKIKKLGKSAQEKDKIIADNRETYKMLLRKQTTESDEKMEKLKSTVWDKYNTQLEKTKKYKDLSTEAVAEAQFIKRRIVELYGPEMYVYIVNHKGCPPSLASMDVEAFMKKHTKEDISLNVQSEG